MRRLTVISISVLTALVSCTSAKEYDAAHTLLASLNGAISVVSSSLDVDPEGGVATAEFSASKPLSAVSAQEWCTTSVDGMTVTMSCTANPSLSERHCVVTVSNEDALQRLVVTQRGQYTSFVNMPSVFKATCSATRVFYDVPTNVAVKAESSEPSWCHVAVTDQTGMIWVTENPDLDSRRCKAVFSTDSKSFEVEVVQSGRFVLDLPSEVEFAKLGGSIAGEFSSAESYTVECSSEWLQYSIEADSLRISAPADSVPEPRNAALTIKTSSGHSRTIEVTQKLLPSDYLGSWDYSFQSAWGSESTGLSTYAVEPVWDKENGQIVMDLVSYTLRFDYNEADGLLYFSPQKAYSSSRYTYDTWVGIVGTNLLDDGSADPSQSDPDPAWPDVENYWQTGVTFDPAFSLVFDWSGDGLGRLVLSHCTKSDFPVYKGVETSEQGVYEDRYGDPSCLLRRCYGFRVALFRVFYDQEERVAPHYMAYNYHPAAYHYAQHVDMYGPVTLERK